MYGDDDVLFPVDDSNQEEYIPVSSFNHLKWKIEGEKDVELFEKHDVKRDARKKNDLFYYYCTICGRSCLIYDEKLEESHVRKLDSTIIVQKEGHYFKSYMENGDILQIKHDNGILSKCLF